MADDPKAVRRIYLDIGRFAGRMHNQAANWRIPTGFERHAWDVEGLVGGQPVWGRFWELRALSDDQRRLLMRAREAVRDDLWAFGRAPEDYSLIHADFVPENFLDDDGRLQLIDFDDAGFGWHLFDLSTALYFIQNDPHYALARRSLVDGYREERPLPERKLAKLPLFMAARSVTYVGWVHTRQETETAAELTPILVDLCCRTVREYLASR